MAYQCKNRCGVEQDAEWQYIKGAWLPVSVVCKQDLLITADCSITQNCSTFSSPNFVWDACRTDHMTLLEETNVSVWTDLNESAELTTIEEEEGKEPALTTAINGSEEFNVLEFNGINQGLNVFGISETAFTIVVVVNNLATNLSEDTGTIIAINTDPFFEQIVLGYEDGNIVIKSDTSEAFDDVVEPIASNDGFQVLAMRYDGIEGTENVELFVNGGEASTNSSSFVFTSNESMLLEVGASYTEHYLNGQIAWVAYYDSAISNSELNRAIAYAGRTYNIDYSPVS